MRDFKGTPGPWFLDGVVLCNKDFIVGGGGHSFHNKANKDLIGSAPELLDALQLLVAEQTGGEKSCGHNGFTCTCPYDKARAAIAKALGESQ